MARSTSAGSSNNPLERWDALRRGTSSSTSESGLDKSGTSGTTDRPSPAPTVENPSSPAQVPSPAPLSTADSTDGSGQETTSSPASPSGSSEDSAALKEATPDQVLEADLDVPEPEPAVEPYAGISGFEAMELARDEYAKGNLDESERLLAIAEKRGENASAVARARGYIAGARARAVGAAPSENGASGAGPGEADPSTGGFLVP